MCINFQKTSIWGAIPGAATRRGLSTIYLIVAPAKRRDQTCHDESGQSIVPATDGAVAPGVALVQSVTHRVAIKQRHPVQNQHRPMAQPSGLENEYYRPQITPETSLPRSQPTDPAPPDRHTYNTHDHLDGRRGPTLPPQLVTWTIHIVPLPSARMNPPIRKNKKHTKKQGENMLI